ncbi:MAG: AbrB/MazE/SpoVT family DNA-binding domain-containing protein [Thaumarchaeota archaeon]|nr:AbrB/MazE/SpoVT family DNA-binding domain-containing protein [Nitrososphaerota archaeon]
MGETTKMDDKGRVTVPKQIREKLDLRPDQDLSVELREREIVLKLVPTVKEFSSSLRGCVTGPTIEPLELKKIWDVPNVTDNDKRNISSGIR